MHVCVFVFMHVFAITSNQCVHALKRTWVFCLPVCVCAIQFVTKYKKVVFWVWEGWFLKTKNATDVAFLNSGNSTKKQGGSLT